MIRIWKMMGRKREDGITWWSGIDFPEPAHDGEEVTLCEMTAEPVNAILSAMARDGKVAEEVLNYLDLGMWDEWDAGLDSRTEIGWGPDELAIAARTAMIREEYVRTHPEEKA